MTSGSHLSSFFLLRGQIESEGRKKTGIVGPTGKEVCDTGGAGKRLAYGVES